MRIIEGEGGGLEAYSVLENVPLVFRFIPLKTHGILWLQAQDTKDGV